jgi:hypothetical protein
VPALLRIFREGLLNEHGPTRAEIWVQTYTGPRSTLFAPNLEMSRQLNAFSANATTVDYRGIDFCFDTRCAGFKGSTS